MTRQGSFSSFTWIFDSFQLLWHLHLTQAFCTFVTLILALITSTSAIVITVIVIVIVVVHLLLTINENSLSDCQLSLVALSAFKAFSSSSYTPLLLDKTCLLKEQAVFTTSFFHFSHPLVNLQLTGSAWEDSVRKGTKEQLGSESSWSWISNLICTGWICLAVDPSPS